MKTKIAPIIKNKSGNSYDNIANYRPIVLKHLTLVHRKRLKKLTVYITGMLGANTITQKRLTSIYTTL